MTCEKEVDGWIFHNDGKCPVPGSAIVIVRIRNGMTLPPCEASQIFWSNGGTQTDLGQGDVVAYKVDSSVKFEKEMTIFEKRERVLEIDSMITNLHMERSRIIDEFSQLGFVMIDQKTTIEVPTVEI